MGHCIADYIVCLDLSTILADPTSDWETLLWAWQGWRDESGKKIPDMYEEFVELLNAAALMNGRLYMPRPL